VVLGTAGTEEEDKDNNSTLRASRLALSLLCPLGCDCYVLSPDAALSPFRPSLDTLIMRWIGVD
jgi:hypothetical protein